jgi:hypothetical protein
MLTYLETLIHSFDFRDLSSPFVSRKKKKSPFVSLHIIIFCQIVAPASKICIIKTNRKPGITAKN